MFPREGERGQMFPRKGRGQMALLATLLLSAPASPAVAQENQHIENTHYRRRIYTETKAKVVVAVWGAHFNAALAIWQQG